MCTRFKNCSDYLSGGRVTASKCLMLQKGSARHVVVTIMHLASGKTNRWHKYTWSLAFQLAHPKDSRGWVRVYRELLPDLCIAPIQAKCQNIRTSGNGI